MIYADHLQRAAARSRSLGYPAAISAGVALPDAVIGAAIEGLADLRAVFAARLSSQGCDMSLECARMTLAALPRFVAATGQTPIVTLGSVAFDRMPILYADVENLRELRRRACYHVWWSFDDVQIIDLTLLAHLALLKSDAPPPMMPVVGAPQHHARIRWRPYLIGESLVADLVSDVLQAAER